MLKDITLGQYYPGNTPIHRLDPRVKLFGTLVFVVSLFIAKNPAVYVIAAIFLLTCIYISKVPIKYILRGLKPIMVIMAFSMLFNIFGTDGRVLVRIWKLKITYEGLLQAAYTLIRLMFLIMGSSVMTLTTTPNSLTDGLEKSMRFLKVIKFPVHEIAMMMSIALRFIPILADEADKIMKAQQARGVDFETGGIFKRVKAMVPILIPLFISAIRRAYDLANAMDARCYKGGDGRTRMKPLKYHKSDFLGYLIILAYLACMILAKIIWNLYLRV